MIYDVLGAISQSYEENILSSQGGLAEGLYQEEDPKGHQHISQTLAYLHKPLFGLQCNPSSSNQAHQTVLLILQKQDKLD